MEIELLALIMLIPWLAFVISYICVRARYPQEGKGVHKIKKGKKYADDGFDKNGFSPLGFHKNGTRYDDNGFDREGNPMPAGTRKDLDIYDVYADDKA